MKRVLVVEDEPSIMSLIVILLEREGYGVIQAASAEEGIRLAAEQAPNLILMDVALPGMDGLEATRLLKSRDATSRIPIVAGCDGFIVKPLSTRHFIGEIARILRERKG
jgi:CheY-like chemotaxis protein